MDRDERRWMQKENWKVVSKLIRQERQRVHKFVTTAEAKDPRILSERDGERMRKEKIKADKIAALQAAQQAVLDAKRCAPPLVHYQISSRSSLYKVLFICL